MSAQRLPVWLAIRLPCLPLEVFGFTLEQPEAVIIVQKQRVLSATRGARESGIAIDMPATTAQMLTDCQLVERDLQLEQAAIQQVVDSLYQFTPYLQPLQPNTCQHAGVVAEVSRSLKLFHGLSEIQQQISQHLQQLGYQFLLTAGHTEQCAWLLSWLPESTPPSLPDKAVYIEQLNTLPVTLLCQCHCDTLPIHKLQTHVEELQHSGFNVLADITRQIEKQSTASLRKRWGVTFCDFLSRIYDIDHQLHQAPLFTSPRPEYHPEQTFYDSIQFDYPLKTVEQLLHPMAYLLQNLTRYLTTRQQQCQKIEWFLYDIYHRKQNIDIYYNQQQNSGDLLLEFSRIQLEAQTLHFEVDTIELLCRQTFKKPSNTQPLPFNEADSNRSNIENNFAIVTARLKARLGDQALYGINYGDQHIPELSNQKTTALQQQQRAPKQLLPRPNWLFDTPHSVTEKQQQLQWRGGITLLQGPERIEGHWWQQQTARDYFIAQRDDGLRLWVYYDLQNRHWFVQGVFG